MSTNVCVKCGNYMPVVKGATWVYEGGLGSCCAAAGAKKVAVWLTAEGASEALRWGCEFATGDLLFEAFDARSPREKYRDGWERTFGGGCR